MMYFHFVFPSACLSSMTYSYVVISTAGGKNAAVSLTELAPRIRFRNADGFCGTMRKNFGKFGGSSVESWNTGSDRGQTVDRRGGECLGFGGPLNMPLARASA